MSNALTSRCFYVTICIMQGFGGAENGEKKDKENTILGQGYSASCKVLFCRKKQDGERCCKR